MSTDIFARVGPLLPAQAQDQPSALETSHQRSLTLTWLGVALAFTFVLLPLSPTVAQVPDPVTSVDANPATIEEGGAEGAFTVRISDSADCGYTANVTVGYEGTAIFGVDYVADTPQGSVLSFAVNCNEIGPVGSGVSVPITITPLTDNIIEPNETIVVRTSSCEKDFGEGAPQPFACDASATMTILDATLGASIEASDPAASKETLDPGEFLVSLTNPAPEGGVTVVYSLGGSATAGVDFEPLPGSILIPAGQTSAPVTVVPLPGEPGDPDTSLVATLQPGQTYGVGTPASATVAITGLAPDVSLTSVAGNEQLVTAREPLQPFVVRATSTTGAAAGLIVLWTLEQGDGSLSTTRSVTDASGQTSSVLTPGTETQYRVRATLETTGASTVFTALASAPLAQLPGLSPGQRSLAGALDSLCPRLNAIGQQRSLTAGEQDLLSQCRTLIAAAGSNPGAAAQGVVALTPEQASAPRKLITQISSVQVDNLTERLTALRRGASGISLRGLTVGIGDQAVSGGLLASAMEKGLGTGGGASADDAWPFERLGIFVTGDVQWGTKDRSTNEDGFDFDTLGLTAGADYRFTDGLILGAALGYAGTRVDIDAEGGKLDGESWSLSLYGTFYPTDHFYLEGSATYGWDSYDQERNIAYSLLGDPRQADARFDGSQYSLLLGAGYDLIRGGTILDMYGRLRYTSASLDDYQERGASGLDLVIEGQDAISFKSILGAQVSRSISTQRAVLIPQGWVEWEHEFENGDDEVQGYFANDPNRFGFALPTDRLETDLLRLGVGLGAQFGQGRVAFISYQTALGMQDYSEHNVTAGIRIEF
jgi:outer membrane autotransporter protein